MFILYKINIVKGILFTKLFFKMLNFSKLIPKNKQKLNIRPKLETEIK